MLRRSMLGKGMGMLSSSMLGRGALGRGKGMLGWSMGRLERGRSMLRRCMLGRGTLGRCMLGRGMLGRCMQERGMGKLRNGMGMLRSRGSGPTGERRQTELRGS